MVSKYTTTFREYYGSETPIDDIRADLFNFNYNFFDDVLKKDLEIDFICHYYVTEIGAQTMDSFKFYLSNKYPHVLEKYSFLFQEIQRLTEKGTEELFGSGRSETFTQTDGGSEDIENVTEYGRSVNNDRTDSTTGESTISNTPETYQPNTDLNYFNNVNKNKNELTSNSTEKNSGSDTERNNRTRNLTTEYTRRVTGNAINDHNYELLIDYNNKFMSLKEAFCNEFKDLFMLCW